MKTFGVTLFSISKDRYLVWQRQMESQRWYRSLVVFSGIYSILLFIPLGVFLLLSQGGWIVAVYCLAGLVLARGIVTETISYFYRKQRPYQLYSFEPIHSWLFSAITLRENSFPSGHVVSVVSISTVLYPFYPGLAVAGFFLALVVGYGRVRLGNHFPLDVLGGFVIGLACGLLVIKFIITP